MTLVLFLVAGSSCSGTSTALAVMEAAPGVVVHDVDEGGVPHGADTAWRQRRLETWVRHALDREGDGMDVVLAGQSPLGELLASPSSVLMDGVGACLVDVDDRTRLERLAARDGERWDEAALQGFLGWARWHREHALDPSRRQEVITSSGWSAMCWDRWAGWNADDPRWNVPVIESTGVAPQVVAQRISDVVMAARDARDKGILPLARGWDLR